MSLGKAETGQDRIFTLLIFLFPLGMGSIKHYTSTLFLLMTLAGCYYTVRNRARLRVEYRTFVAWLLILSAAILLSLINSDDLFKGLVFSTKPLYILAFIPLLLSQQSLSRSLLPPFFSGLLVSGPVNLLIAFYSIFVVGEVRAHAGYGPPLFGDMMVLGGLMLMAFLMSGYIRNSLQKVWALVAMACFFVASILSDTRVDYLVFLIVFPTIIFLCKAKFNRQLLLRVVVLGVLFVGVVSFLSINDMLPGRKLSTVKNVQLYTQGGNPNTSIGARFMMWGVTIKMFQRHPLIGSGYGDFRHDLQQEIDEGGLGMNRTYRHAHNVFFDILGGAGIIGLLSMLMALVIVPLRYFMKINALSASGAVSRVAGITVILCYALFGLTEAWLAISPLLVSYIVCVFVFISGSTQETET